MSRRTPRFALDQRIRFTDTVRKDRGTTEQPTTYVSNGLPETFERASGTTHREGVVVGQRVLHDYAIEKQWESGDGEASTSGFWTTMPRPIKGTARTAWLVSFSLRHKPVLVLDEHAEAIEERAHA